jgi:uncharacterized Zn finger protein
MSWYRYGYGHDDDDDRYVREEEIAVADDAIRFEGPMRAQGQRGAIGATWWGEQWVAAMQRLGGARLDRGKSYARAGRVKDLTIQHGMAFARVQGSRRRPYQSRFSLKTLTPEEWSRALDALAAEAIHAAKLLAGEMPSDIEGIFHGLGLSLFPRSNADITFSCSCPDWGDPCKHCAAIYYLVAERLDADPFILFHLRGYTRERVLEELRLRRAGVGHDMGAALAEGQRAVEALDVDANAFWSVGAELPALPAPAIPAQLPLMAQRGTPPAGGARDWTSVYQQIAETALAWLGNGEGTD